MSVSDPIAPARGPVPAWVRGLLAVERVSTACVTVLACAMLAVAACVGFYQVLARFVLEQPATWSEVLVRTLLIWMVYLGVVGAMRAGALVSVDLMRRMAKGRWARLLDGLITGSTLAVLVILLWAGIQIAWRVRFQVMAGLEVSITWAYAAIPVGAAFAILAVLAHHFDPRRLELDNAV